MTRNRALTGWLAGLILWVLAAPAAAIPPAHIVAERSLGERQLELTIQTAAFSAPTRVQVFLPQGYDDHAGRRWPVTYYLHGAQGDETRFGDWYGDLIEDVPSIFVAPSGGILGFYTDWYRGGAGGPPMYETYDIDQLIPLIETRFRAAGTRAQRAVIGESMGGYGVMTYATRHPDLFATAISISGFLDSNFTPAQLVVSAGSAVMGGQPDDIYGSRLTQEVRWRGHNPVDLASNLRDVVLQVRTAEGIPDLSIEPPGAGTATDCALEKTVATTTHTFHEQLDALGIEHEWQDYPLGCHSVPQFRRAFVDALPGLEDVFAHPRPAPKTIDYRSIEPRFSVWGWRVAADPGRALEFLQLDDAGRRGLTLTGSGTTTVRTPAYFKGRRRVAAGGKVLRPDRAGRLHLRIDLGPAHPDQQYTAGGQNEAGYFTTRTVRFRPCRRARRGCR